MGRHHLPFRFSRRIARHFGDRPDVRGVREVGEKTPQHLVLFRGAAPGVATLPRRLVEVPHPDGPQQLPPACAMPP